jgi:two-component system cell cycle sensor histidine kinase/response regulator CckA
MSYSALSLRTILIAEDDGGVRHLLARVLSREGYQVLSVESAVAALEVWGEHRAEIDLLLTDIVMPGGVSGRELAERLQREQPALKVVYMTGDSGCVNDREFQEQSGPQLLRKPFSVGQLVSMVESRLAAST